MFPPLGLWSSVVNTKRQFYGGSALGNEGDRTTEDIGRDGFTQSLNVTLSPFDHRGVQVDGRRVARSGCRPRTGP